MNEKRRACRGGPRPTILQAAVSLVDALTEDGLDMQVGAYTFGVSSSSTVDAVIAVYGAACLPTRPDIVDIAAARRSIATQRLSTEWLAAQMQRLIRRRVNVEPEIL
ncbi:MAG: hypothetical protein QM774_03800 [Gordonia sp. (in: high G+C Gram-positive bacteria)]|uniref:hypothetical protein n=1 Tax=Gordonia sp. (in: high G+C Gram-positive bacteria) TaxID=84139 RepID=UPI0039E67DED